MIEHLNAFNATFWLDKIHEHCHPTPFVTAVEITQNATIEGEDGQPMDDPTNSSEVGVEGVLQGELVFQGVGEDNINWHGLAKSIAKLAKVKMQNVAVTPNHTAATNVSVLGQGDGGANNSVAVDYRVTVLDFLADNAVSTLDAAPASTFEEEIAEENPGLTGNMQLGEVPEIIDPDEIQIPEGVPEVRTCVDAMFVHDVTRVDLKDDVFMWYSD